MWSLKENPEIFSKVNADVGPINGTAGSVLSFFSFGVIRIDPKKRRRTHYCIYAEIQTAMRSENEIKNIICSAGSRVALSLRRPYFYHS